MADNWDCDSAGWQFGLADQAEVGEPVVAVVVDSVQVVVMSHTPAVVGTVMSNIDCMVAVAVTGEGGDSNIARCCCMIDGVGLQVGVEEGRPTMSVDAELQWHS